MYVSLLCMARPCPTPLKYSAWQGRFTAPAALPPSNNPSITCSPQALKQRLQQQLLEAARTPQCLETCTNGVQEVSKHLAACQDAHAWRAAFEQAAAAYASPSTSSSSSQAGRPSPFAVPQRRRKAAAPTTGSLHSCTSTTLLLLPAAVPTCSSAYIHSKHTVAAVLCFPLHVPAQCCAVLQPSHPQL